MEIHFLCGCKLVIAPAVFSPDPSQYYTIPMGQLYQCGYCDVDWAGLFNGDMSSGLYPMVEKITMEAPTPKPRPLSEFRTSHCLASDWRNIHFTPTTPRELNVIRPVTPTPEAVERLKEAMGNVQPQLTTDPATATDTSLELARVLHRVVRSMHDGQCPRCLHIGADSDFKIWKVPPGETAAKLFAWSCGQCGFIVTMEEANAALALFRPYMATCVEKFDNWRKSRTTKPWQPEAGAVVPRGEEMKMYGKSQGGKTQAQQREVEVRENRPWEPVAHSEWETCKPQPPSFTLEQLKEIQQKLTSNQKLPYETAMALVALSGDTTTVLEYVTGEIKRMEHLASLQAETVSLRDQLKQAEQAQAAGGRCTCEQNPCQCGIS